MTHRWLNAHRASVCDSNINNTSLRLAIISIIFVRYKRCVHIQWVLLLLLFNFATTVAIIRKANTDFPFGSWHESRLAGWHPGYRESYCYGGGIHQSQMKHFIKYIVHWNMQPRGSHLSPTLSRVVHHNPLLTLYALYFLSD